MKPLVQLVVLGAGTIGQMVNTFAQYENWDVVMVDPYSDRATVKYDGFDYVRDHTFAPGTYFLNAVPVYDPERVETLVRTVIEKGGHYLDLSEDLFCGDRLYEKFSTHQGNLVMPHCGLAPGMSTVLAAEMTRRFSEVESVTINVGALPLHVDNEYSYYPTWSPDGLVNEYMNPAYVIENGELVRKTPDFLSTFPVIIDGKRYESCQTSGGLGTWVKKPNGIKNLRYRTLRYPGHWDAVYDALTCPYQGNSTVEERKKAQFLEDMKRLRPPEDEKRPDQVVIHIEVQGMTDKGMRTARDTYVINDWSFASAIQITTAFGPLLMIDSHAKKLLPSRYLTQESVILTPGIKASKFFRQIYTK